MRSSWEVKWALYLDSLGYKWFYEPRGFQLLEGKFYYPDFYVIDLDEYHEVKGRMDKRSKEKIEAFISLYPNEKLKIINGVLLKQIGIL